MKTLASYFTLASVAFATAMWPGARAIANSKTENFDKAMQPVLASYLKIYTSLAADSIEGVPAFARAIVKATAQVKRVRVKGEHAKHYKNLPGTIAKTARALEQAKTLDAARKAFKEISKPMAMWATMSKPAGVDVMFCSMAKASWLQPHTKVSNPYFGAKMRGCVEIVGGINHAKK